ncbi:hypothetical protein LEP1GSC100_1465 [Leptospira interrogans serovar Bataviae str. UI 08561]|nr:hypothetical protein LEP1GSC100_1465 [Leptospira interrogans serovar Bataviae str. UI 08561]
MLCWLVFRDFSFVFLFFASVLFSILILCFAFSRDLRCHCVLILISICRPEKREQ